MIDGLKELGSFVGQMAEDSRRREAAQLAPLETNERIEQIERRIDENTAKRDAADAKHEAVESKMLWIACASLAVSIASMIFGALAVLIAFYALTH